MPRSPSSGSARSCLSSKANRVTEEGSDVTPAVDRAARDRPLSDQLERLAGQLCRTPSCRYAGRHIAHRRHRQPPGQPAHEQIPADAMVPPRRSSSAPVCRLQRQARVQLRPAVPAPRSRLRAGQGCLTLNHPAVPITLSIGAAEIAPDELTSAFIDRADGALYAAKQDGRNRVVAENDSRTRTG